MCRFRTADSHTLSTPFPYDGNRLHTRLTFTWILECAGTADINPTHASSTHTQKPGDYGMSCWRAGLEGEMGAQAERQHPPAIAGSTQSGRRHDSRHDASLLTNLLRTLFQTVQQTSICCAGPSGTILTRLSNIGSLGGLALDPSSATANVLLLHDTTCGSRSRRAACDQALRS